MEVLHDDSDDRAIIEPDAKELYLRIVAGQQSSEEDHLAVSQLLALGLLRHGSDGDYVPVDPRYVGARLASAYQAEAARQVALSADVHDAFGELSDAFAAGPADGRGMVEFLQGASVINARLVQVLGSCSEELLVCQPGGARRKEVLTAVRERDLDALRRGVVMRTLYHEDARAGQVMHSWVAEMGEAGAEYRTLTETFKRMIIIDRRVAVIPGVTDEIAYIVHNSGIAAFLADTFSRDWARATPWFGVVGDSRGAVKGRQEMILHKLAAGHGSQQIALDLGIAPRTLADAISELKDAYGAKTLFALACAWKDGALTQEEMDDDDRRRRRMQEALRDLS